MFYFRCKSNTILRHRGRHSMYRLSPIIHKELYHFLQQSSSVAIPITSTVRFISSRRENPKEYSFVVSYFITKFGFSPEFALSASKHVNFKTPDQPDSVVDMFKRYGFSESEIFKLVKKYPKVLSCRPVKNLLPKLEFFLSKGFASVDITRVLCTAPPLLGRSLENCIAPNFNFLCEILQSNHKAIFSVKGNSWILCCGTRLGPCINILRDNGVPRLHIALLVQNWPICAATGPNHFRKSVERVKEMGFDPSKSQFVMAVMVLIRWSKSAWERKFAIYKSWGWSEEEFLVAFCKQPLCMTASDGKIMAVMDFLINEMDCESSFVAKNPSLLLLSLKKRIIPRASVIQFLLSNKLIDKKPNLITLFLIPEEFFLKKFVNCFHEAPQLLMLYREKLDLS